MKSIRLLVALGVPALLFACQRDSQPEPRLTPARGTAPSYQSIGARSTAQMKSAHGRAVYAVGEYLCDREVRCGRVEGGAGTRNDCVRNRVSGGFESLKPDVCGDIDSEAMSLCLSSIRASTDCSADADFQSIPECNSTLLCGRGGETPTDQPSDIPTDQPGGETTPDQPD